MGKVNRNKKKAFKRILKNLKRELKLDSDKFAIVYLHLGNDRMKDVVLSSKMDLNLEIKKLTKYANKLIEYDDFGIVVRPFRGILGWRLMEYTHTDPTYLVCSALLSTERYGEEGGKSFHAVCIDYITLTTGMTLADTVKEYPQTRHLPTFIIRVVKSRLKLLEQMDVVVKSKVNGTFWMKDFFKFKMDQENIPLHLVS